MDVNPDGAGAWNAGLKVNREVGAVLHGFDLR